MPTGVFVCGAPGTGKSSAVNTILKKAKVRTAILIDPDKIGAPREQVSALAIDEVYATIEERRNFVYVGTCVGPGTIGRVIAAMKERGYRVVVAFVYTTLPTALKRNDARPEQPVAQEVAIERHNALSSTIAKKYMGIPGIDELYLYSNETELTLLFSRTHEKESCHVPGTEFYFKYC